MPMPRNHKQVRALIRGINYYGKFLAYLWRRLRPINALLKKGIKFAFTPTMETIARDIRNELAKPLILVYPDWDAVAENFRPFRLYCDASRNGFGATLEQEQLDGTVPPIILSAASPLTATATGRPSTLKPVASFEQSNSYAVIFA